MLTRMLFINLYVCIIVINLVCLLVKRSNKYLKCNESGHKHSRLSCRGWKNPAKRLREFVRKLVFDTSYINIVINLNMYEKVKQKDNKDQKGKRNHISNDTLFCNYGHTDKGVGS